MQTTEDRKQRIKDKLKAATLRKKAAANDIGTTVKETNQIVIGWINYYALGDMSGFMKELGTWLRHKVRVIIVKQWKRPRTIYRKHSVLVIHNMTYYQHDWPSYSFISKVRIHLSKTQIHLFRTQLTNKRNPNFQPHS